MPDRHPQLAAPWVALALTLLSAAAVYFFHSHGWLLYYGDAESHLNIARRIVDSQTPGYDQVGIVWLPLPHWLMLPLVRVDALWRTGLAGTIPPAICFVIATLFLFAAARRVFDSAPAAVAATALFALNPNLLYLQSTPMTESIFFACLMALLYFTVRFRDTQAWAAVIGAGIAACAGTLTRYEGWFLIPFVAAYFFLTAQRRRVQIAFVFGVLASLGPLYWLAHNWWIAGDMWASFTGPYSAYGIQGNKPYPGKGAWRAAWLYFRTVAQLCVGPSLALLGMAGAVAALSKRAFWPLILLALPSVFYIWSMHSSGSSPIYVPTLWPNTYYNTRYGLAVLPLLALASAALVAIMPQRLRVIAALVVVAAGSLPWLLHPAPSHWITWEESRVNSEARRAWTHQAAQYLAPRYVRGSGIITSSGDLIGVFREMGIPLRDTFTGDNGLPWIAAVRRPELFLHQEWAVVMAGDQVESAVIRSGCYTLKNSITIKDAPVIEIYRRTGGNHGL